MNYPNPDRVVYPTGQPLAFTCQLTTRAGGRIYPMHEHGSWLDKDGNGNTDLDAGHFHRVRGFRILPDESDGHSHEMTMLPCGASAPRTVGRDGTVPGNALMAQGGTNMSIMGGAPGGSGFPWKLVVGTVVVVGLAVGAYMLYKHAQEGHGGEG